MQKRSIQKICIAAALVDDGEGRILLVRKAGTRWFMQPGGKIEGDENALSALRRELMEEIGLTLKDQDFRHLGQFSANAANEPDCIVEAEIYHVRTQFTPVTGAEIEEAIWVSQAEARALPLAPLTRDHMLPRAERLNP